ncbi:MAG: hypothetical protein WBG50_27325 [Desulfomonilaceae bacterium]
MKNWFGLLLVLILALYSIHAKAAGGIAPEQIFQTVIDWHGVIGTWEVLPDEHPLGEGNKDNVKLPHRTLMALRKDGTCRIFNGEHPTGSDGLWTFNDHQMSITFKNGPGIGYYVYGIKGDFMVTRSPVKKGKDQLWSRVK